MYTQSAFDIRCEWGLAGVQHLTPACDVVIIVDVLSFTTCVDIATARGAVVYPYRGENAAEFAQAKNALLAASHDRSARYSLSPASLTDIPADTHIVLPSPNGSTLSMATGDVPTFAACLRNAAAVAQAAQTVGRRIAVIAAGERWPDGTLRPALEDWLGAGAVIAALNGGKSPEAQAAERAFQLFQSEMDSVISQIASGLELIGKGFPQDVALAGALNVSSAAPRLLDGAYRWRG